MQKPDSFYKPWLDILPDSYEDSPFFYTDSEKDFLTGSYFTAVLEEENEIIDADYEVLSQRVPNFNSTITLERFK